MIRRYDTKEEIKRKILLYYKVKEIASIMKWDFPFCEYSNTYTINDKKGNKITLGYTYRSKNRICIFCNTYGVNSITVSPEKPARTIVYTDIKRRFFPEFSKKATEINRAKKSNRQLFINQIKDFLDFGKVLNTTFRRQQNGTTNIVKTEYIDVDINEYTEKIYRVQFNFRTRNKQKMIKILTQLKAIEGI